MYGKCPAYVRAITSKLDSFTMDGLIQERSKTFESWSLGLSLAGHRIPRHSWVIVLLSTIFSCIAVCLEHSLKWIENVVLFARIKSPFSQYLQETWRNYLQKSASKCSYLIDFFPQILNLKNSCLVKFEFWLSLWNGGSISEYIIED